MKRPSNFSTTLSTDAETQLVTVAVIGEFESATIAAFEVVVSRAMKLNPVQVSLDLSETQLIDSAAIGAIMRFRRDLSADGTDLVVDAPHDYQKRLFKIAGLGHVLNTE